MAELTLQRLAELELAIGSEYDGELHLHETTAHELLAAARRLAELESALEFLRDGGFCCEGPDYREVLHADDMMALATQHGWPGIESGKGGDDV